MRFWGAADLSVMLHFLLLSGAGVVAGVLSTVVGLASLVSYPALLLAGLPPVAANVTNTVALVATGLGAAAGSRTEPLPGNGVLLSEATDELRELAESADVPVATTLIGKGAFPEDHPLALGMTGIWGTRAANETTQEADVVLWDLSTRASRRLLECGSATVLFSPDGRWLATSDYSGHEYRLWRVPTWDSNG